MDFLKWYKYSVESGDQEPPEAVWENIQDELDIEQSWQVINQHLTRKAVQQRNTVLAIAASFLLLISVGTFWYLTRDTNPEGFRSLADEINVKEDETSGTESSAPEQLIVDNKPVEQKEPVNTENRQSFLAEESMNTGDILTERKELNSNIQLPDRSAYATLQRRMIAMNVDMNSEELIEEQDKGYIEEGTEKRTSLRKFYIGSTGQLANTWLLNDKTYTGLESSSLTSSDVSLGSNFGVFLGTNLFRRIDLQMDLNFLVRHNQAYHEYLDGHYVENKMEFNYSQLGLSIRYYFVSKRILQGEHGVNVGGYAGYLRNAYQNVDGKTISLYNNYNRLDYGIFVSYEYVFPVYRQLGLGTGFRVYYGLQNIYSGNESIPAYLNKTNNASANLTLSLRYMIK